jgi:Family of unknown function (DUF5947)
VSSLAVLTDKPGNALATLRQFVRKPKVEAAEKCELCANRILEPHDHVLELSNRRVLCACEPCSILFGNEAAARYRRIPRDVRRLRDFYIDDQEWGSLLVPINLAFFFYSSADARVVAQYPSPAGAMHSQLDLEYWQAIENRLPSGKKLQPDVEALLVNRVATPAQYYFAPIDHCYRLVGVLRTNWRGLSGGTEVWKEIDRFFNQLRLMSSEVANA